MDKNQPSAGFCPALEKKTQILIEFLEGTKKVQLAAKKSFLVGIEVPLGFRGFRTLFLLLTTPYVMFEIKKKLKFLLNS